MLTAAGEGDRKQGVERRVNGERRTFGLAVLAEEGRVADDAVAGAFEVGFIGLLATRLIEYGVPC
jgi:hypothetical protein